MAREPFEDVPWDAVDRATVSPRYGSYRGALRHVDLAPLVPDRLERLAQHKRWIWAMVSTKELAIAFAVVDLGYASSAFGFAWSPSEGMLVDRALLGAPGFGTVRRDGVDRVRARFRGLPLVGAGRVSVGEPVGGERIEVELALPDLVLSGRADLRGAPPPMTAIAPIPGGLVNVTEKRVRAPFTGAALVHGRRVSFGDGDDASFGWDVTDGILARHTRWKWAFAEGRLEDGTPFGLNLVQEFAGAPECTLWLDGELVPVEEGRFRFDPAAPLGPWVVESGCGTVRLEVTPSAMHRDQQDLRLLRSKFVQAIGLGRGVIRHAGRERRFERVVSVVEDQDMLW